MFKCSPVPASFFPYISTALHWCHAMVLDLFGGRPDAHPPPGGRRWLLRSRAAGSESPVPSRTAATPPRPRSTAASLPSHLFFFCSSTTASGSHWRSPPLPAARSSQHRDPTQQRGLSDSVSLLPPGLRHQCNEVRIYGKKEAGTGEHSNTFNNQINKQQKSGSPSRTTAANKTQTKIQAWSSLVFHCRHSSFYSFRSSSVGLETGEWRRCRSLSFTPPASLRSHGSRPRPTRHTLQFIKNATARLIFIAPKRTHVIPLFINLHWLPIAARIKFKALMFAYKTTSDSAPLYLNSVFQTYMHSKTLRSAGEWHIIFYYIYLFSFK